MGENSEGGMGSGLEVDVDGDGADDVAAQHIRTCTKGGVENARVRAIHAASDPDATVGRMNAEQHIQVGSQRRPRRGRKTKTTKTKPRRGRKKLLSSCCCRDTRLLENKLCTALLVLQTGCFLYSAAILLPEDVLIGGATAWANSTATLCPRESICAEGYTELVMLALSRGSAYFMYPALGSIFLTKCHALNTWLSTTQISLRVPLVDLHNLHTATGIGIALMTFIHAVFHIARWIRRGDMDLLVRSEVGVSGLIGVLTMAPIVALMKSKPLKMQVSWETRKTAHMLSLVMAAAMCWHTFRLCVFMIVILAIYAADRGVRSFSMTHRIVDSQWHRLETGVQLTFKNPPGWDSSQLGYINVAVPWISKKQWHPFSVYSHPNLEGHSAVCISAAGDWTKQLHKSISQPTTRPVWIQGPFVSPYTASMEYDNLMLVASGIGITPAISCMREYSEERRVSLLWMCRDQGLLQFFLQACPFDDMALTVIHYTGTATLQLPKGLPSSVHIIPGRPKIQETVAQLMRCIEKGLPLPFHMLRASTRLKAESALAQSFMTTAQTPLVQLEILTEQLLSTGISAVEMMTLFGFEQEDAELTASQFEHNLRVMGVSHLLLSSEDIVGVLGQLDADGNGAVSQSKMHHFISRMQHREIDEKDHELRDLALQALQVYNDQNELEVSDHRYNRRRRAAISAQPIRQLSVDDSRLRHHTYRLQQRGRVIGGVLSPISAIENTLTNAPEEDVRIMRPFLKLVEYGRDEYILKRGDPSDGNMYVMASGSASIRVNGTIVVTLRAGDRFGETALWKSRPRNADIQADGEGVRCLTLSNDVLQKLPSDTVVRLKISAYAAAAKYGGADLIRIGTSVLRRLCMLELSPGLRETYKKWDLNHKGLSRDDIQNGLANIGISEQVTSRVLLTDIIMDGQTECTFATFKHAIGILTQRLELVQTNAMQTSQSCDDNEKAAAIDYVKNSMTEDDLRRWGMLYCGGAPPVVAALEQTSREFNLSYKSESFNW
jgi:hypothetical protein